jgi:WD40 repeat protein
LLNPGVNAFAFSQDGMRAVHYSIRGAGLWDVAAGRMTRVLDPRPTEAACFVPVGNERGVDVIVAILDRSRELVAFNAAGQSIRKVDLPIQSRVNAMVASPDGHALIVGDDVGDVRLLDLTTWQWTWAMPAHSGAVTSLAFAPDGRTILSGGADGALVLADAGLGRTLHVVARGQAAVRAAQFDADAGHIVATVGDGRTTRSWDLSRATRFAQRAKPTREITRRPEAASIAERLRLGEWFLLQGRPDWARQAVRQAASPSLDARSQLNVARVMWSAGDAAEASKWFAAALAGHQAVRDQTYIILCRDAAAGGEP